MLHVQNSLRPVGGCGCSTDFGTASSDQYRERIKPRPREQVVEDQCMRILELTQRSDELHAICTGIPYCFASRAVSWLTEMTQNPVLARDGNARRPRPRGRGRARATKRFECLNCHRPPVGFSIPIGRPAHRRKAFDAYSIVSSFDPVSIEIWLPQNRPRAGDPKWWNE